MPNIADYLNRRDLETIGRFTATWAVFEQELFSKKCGMWKIRSVISEDKMNCFRIRMVQMSAFQLYNSEILKRMKMRKNKRING